MESLANRFDHDHPTRAWHIQVAHIHGGRAPLSAAGRALDYGTVSVGVQRLSKTAGLIHSQLHHGASSAELAWYRSAP